MDFAVQVKGLEKARWVLATDPVGERLLITHDDQSLHWHTMADCKFVKAQSPDQPRLVMVMQPPKDAVAVVRDLASMRGNNG